MITILFVDDEPNILSGLQRMLRGMRHEWEMHFAASGSEALELLATKPVDVIVSYMKMPGMDGAQLLAAVSDQYPHLIRFLLSGYSEREMILRAVTVAHQYLAKPCDADALKLAITQACALRALLCDESLARLVAQMKIVPSLPRLYTEITQELRKPEPSLKTVAAIIQQDIGMTVKVLQLINSAFFGLHRDISDVSEASALLGLDTISALVLGVGIFAPFPHTPQQRFLKQLWEQSLAVAHKAKAIALCTSPQHATESFTAGLLHKIGQVVVAVNAPQQFRAIQELIENSQLSRTMAEQQVLGVSQVVLGAYLLELWGLPRPLVAAVAYQHQPSAFDANSFTPLTAVHVAQGLAPMDMAELLATPEQYLDQAYLQRLQLWDNVPAWQSACTKKEAHASR